MNDNERQKLTRFLDQLREARVNRPDAEAAGMIREAVIANPDASYLLVQRAMLLELALSNAKLQLSHAGRRPDPAPQVGSSAQAAPGPAGGTSGSFLTQVTSTAAGVVAGSFLYQGIEHLLGRGVAEGGASGALEETTINNFYGTEDEQAWNADTLATDEFQDDGLDSFGDDTFLEGVDDADWV